MRQETIQILSEAEDAAKLMSEETEYRADQAGEAARRAGLEKVAQAEQKADDESARAMRDVRQKAAEAAAGLASNMENKKAAIGARAESAMQKAVSLIIERTVNDEWR